MKRLRAIDCGICWRAIPSHAAARHTSREDERAPRRRQYTIVKGLKNEILCDETLDALGARLDPDRFSRVHRSAIVSLSAVIRLEREGDRKYVLVLSDGLRVPVSRDRLEDVRRALGIA